MQRKGDRRHSNYTTGRVQRSPSSLSLSLLRSYLTFRTRSVVSHTNDHTDNCHRLWQRAETQYAHRGRRDTTSNGYVVITLGRRRAGGCCYAKRTTSVAAARQLRGGDTRRTTDKGELHRGRFARSPLHARSISLSPPLPLALSTPRAPPTLPSHLRSTRRLSARRPRHRAVAAVGPIIYRISALLCPRVSSRQDRPSWLWRLERYFCKNSMRSYTL